VKPAPFAYIAPTSLSEALEALSRPGAKVLAGGQSLLPLLNMRLATPELVVDINRLPDLDRVDMLPAGPGDAGGVRIGALVRHSMTARSELVRGVAPVAAEAVGLVGHAAIRNRGTTVGSLIHADPAAELPAVLALLGGTVEAQSLTRGRRTIAAADLFVGPLQSALDPDELAISAWLPAQGAQVGTAIDEVARRRGDYALVGVAGLVHLDDDLRVADARAAYFSVDVVPVVVDLTDAVGTVSYDAADWSAAGRLAQARTRPGDDIHATAAYRRHLVGTLTQQVLTTAAGRATTALSRSTGPQGAHR
jgi:carbon-monoxide dehydrogenase medium subunit